MFYLQVAVNLEKHNYCVKHLFFFFSFPPYSLILEVKERLQLKFVDDHI